MGGAKMCSGVVVRFGEKCALVWFFSPEFNPPKKIFFPPLSTAEQNTPKEGNLA
jgi:hypothetical protein|tara:strand:- start:1458 stop:1619 length:162 start_codon:yes stop_codon:yes gene_type:complete